MTDVQYLTTMVTLWFLVWKVEGKPFGLTFGLVAGWFLLLTLELVDEVFK